MKNKINFLFWLICMILFPSTGTTQKSTEVAWEDLKECLIQPTISQPNIAVWDGDISGNAAVTREILNAIISVAPARSVVRAISDFERGKGLRLQIPEKQARQERIEARNFFKRDANISLSFVNTSSSEFYRTWQITAKQRLAGGHETLCAASISICEDGQSIAGNCENLKVGNCTANQSCLDVILLEQSASSAYSEEFDLRFEVLCKDDACIDRIAYLYCGLHLPSWNNSYLALFPNSFSWQPNGPLGKVPHTSVLINSTTTKFPQERFGWLSGLQMPESFTLNASLSCWLIEDADKSRDVWSNLFSFLELSASDRNRIRFFSNRHDNNGMLRVPHDYAQPILEQQERIWSQNMLGKVKIFLDR